MKKIKSLLLIVIMMLFISTLNVDAAGVSIKSIKMVDHTGNATELSEPKINGLNINFDMAFSAENDSATYEVVLSNPTNKEYEVNTDKKFGPSNYISYTYELKDKTNRIKANSEVTLNIIIKYEHAVPVDKLVNGQYVESNDLGITLLNEDNPSTFNNLILIALILLITIGLTFIMKKSKRKNQVIVLIALLLVPVTVFALEKLTLTVSTKIVVAEMYDVYYEQAFVKESDLYNGDYVYDNCDYTFRVEQKDGNFVNYKMCNRLFKKDSRKYIPGERVTVSQYSVLVIRDQNKCVPTSDIDLTGNTGSTRATVDNQPGKIALIRDYTCQKDALDNFTAGGYMYGCLFDNNDNIVPGTCAPDDIGVMNFKSLRDNYWNEEAYVSFNAPNEFTMPNHDVYIGMMRMGAMAEMHP